MTFISDKPKRKEKPKRGKSRRWLIIVMLFSLSMLAGILYFAYISLIQLSTDDACDFESNPHIYVKDREENYITNLTGDIYLELPESFNSAKWMEGNPYLWHTGDELIVANLETESVFSFNTSTLDHELSFSASMRYLLVEKSDDNGSNEITIFDGGSQAILAEYQTPNLHTEWTPDESSILLFNSKETSVQLFDLETLTLSDINLPADVNWVLKWMDETRLLYITPAGRFRTWDRLTGQSESVSDIRIEQTYTAGGQLFPNSLARWQWLGGIDSTGNFQLFNMTDESHIAFPIDVSQSVNYLLYPRYILFIFQDTEPSQYKIYYPDSDTMMHFSSPFDELPRLSSDGTFFFYDPTDNRARDYVIQEVATGETMILEEEISQELGWVDIEEQPYLLYSIRTDNGSNLFYLFQPDTKEHCTIGIFNTITIDIQS